jgi:hypothetical protein
VNQQQIAALNALLVAFNQTLPATECAKIEKAITILQATYKDHCPIAES